MAEAFQVECELRGPTPRHFMQRKLTTVDSHKLMIFGACVFGLFSALFWIFFGPHLVQAAGLSWLRSHGVDGSAYVVRVSRELRGYEPEVRVTMRLPSADFVQLVAPFTLRDLVKENDALGVIADPTYPTRFVFRDHLTDRELDTGELAFAFGFGAVLLLIGVLCVRESVKHLHRYRALRRLVEQGSPVVGHIVDVTEKVIRDNDLAVRVWDYKWNWTWRGKERSGKIVRSLRPAQLGPITVLVDDGGALAHPYRDVGFVAIR